MTKPIINYWPNGRVESEEYIVNGEYHRDPLEGPAIILYNYYGENFSYHYFVNGKRHNAYGPAYINYYLHSFEWRFNDTEYTKEVEEYLDKHELTWKNMTERDFDIMWMNIL